MLKKEADKLKKLARLPEPCYVVQEPLADTLTLFEWSAVLGFLFILTLFLV